jgi:hypothetical protein
MLLCLGPTSLVGEATTLAHRNAGHHIVRRSILEGSIKSVSLDLEATTMVVDMSSKMADYLERRQ